MFSDFVFLVNGSDGRQVAREEVASVKREWACNSKAVIIGLQNNPQVTSTAVKGREINCNSSLHVIVKC